MKRINEICTLNLSARVLPNQEQAVPAVCPTRKRLAEAFAVFDKLERQRAHGYDPVFCHLMEQRIIWRELLDLELQDADEQIARISAAALEHTD